MQVHTALDARATIAEGPHWSPGEQALYWIDVKEPALHRFDPATGKDRRWPLTSDVGAFAIADPRTAIIALRHGIHRLDLESSALSLLAPPPFDPALFRFNEGKCDVRGRFWVGVMYDPLDSANDGQEQRASLHCFTMDGGLRPIPDAAELHNSMAWSIDNDRFYLSHSYEQSIYTFAFDADTARLGDRRLFARIEKRLGIPDGAALDVDGHYWCALHGGGRLRRYAPDGGIDRDIPLPVSQPTMCAFAGEDMTSLYITTASDGMDENQRRDEPLAGAILSIDPGVRGVPTYGFTL